MNKITALFAGQASQYQGMGKRWIAEYEGIRQRFEQASNLLDFDLIDLCINGTSAALQRTELSQIAIFTLSYSMFEQFCFKHNPDISYLAGHSLGEITALTAGGVFTFEDALKFVYARGHAMAACCEANPSTMYAIRKIDSESLETILQDYGACEKGIFIANYNTPDETILAGDQEALEDFIDQFSKLVQCIPLAVSGGFHSPYMEGAISNLREVLNEIPIHDFQTPVVNANEGRFYNKEDDVRQLLLDQIVKPVNWHKSLDLLEKSGTRLWIEFGPKDILKKMVLRSVFNPRAFHSDTEDSSILLEELETIEKKKQKESNLIGLCLGVAVATKNNTQDEEAHERVIDAYDKIQDIYDSAKFEKRAPRAEEEETALDLLKLILTENRVSDKEQNERIKQILELANCDVVGERDDEV